MRPSADDRVHALSLSRAAIVSALMVLSAGCNDVFGIHDLPVAHVDAGDAGGCDAAKTFDDPDNCGACGRSCFGARCSAGHCAPRLLAEDAFSGTALAVDPDPKGCVYVADEVDLFSQVECLAKDGSARHIVYRSSSHARIPSLIVEHGAVYFTLVGLDPPSSVFRIAIDDESNVRSLSADDYLDGVTGDGAGSIYLAGRRTGISRAPEDLSSSTVLAPSISAVRIRAERGEGGAVFAASRVGLIAVDKHTLAVDTLYSRGPQDFSVGKTSLFTFIDTDLTEIDKQLGCGGAPHCTTFVARGVGATDAPIGGDATSVFWYDAASGEVRRLQPHAADGVQRVAAATQVLALAQDATALYWLGLGGEVARIAR